MIYRKRKNKIIVFLILTILLIGTALGICTYIKNQKTLVVADADVNAKENINTKADINTKEETQNYSSELMENFFTEVSEIDMGDTLDNYYDKITIGLADKNATKDEQEINISEELNIPEETIETLLNSTEEEIKEYFEGTVYHASVKNDELLITNPYQLKTIILTAENLENTYNAVNIIEGPNNMWFLYYNSCEETKVAYDSFKQDKKVSHVILDSIVEASQDELIVKPQYYTGETSGLSWGIEAMGLDDLQNTTNNSNDIVVAVLDTGCYTANTSLNGRTDNRGKNFVNAVSIESSIGVTNDITDSDGHGTHVSGTIIDGTTSNISVLPIKVLGGDGTGSITAILSAIYYAVECDVDVINMSLRMYN